jgi:type IV secretory pathway TrbD component
MLQSPDRDVLIVSALIAVVVVLAFTGWGVLAYGITGRSSPSYSWLQ